MVPGAVGLAVGVLLIETVGPLTQYASPRIMFVPNIVSVTGIRELIQ
jgi:hypothetical protein